MDEIEQSIFLMIIQLYSNVSLTRKDIQLIISLMMNFITNAYNPFLSQQLNKYLKNAISEEASEQIHIIFTRYEDPFKKFNTESKRFNFFNNHGFQIQPQIHQIDQEKKEKKVTMLLFALKNHFVSRIYL